MLKVGDKVRIVDTGYSGDLFPAGSEHIVTEYRPDVMYPVYIDGWPLLESEVELVE